MAYIGNPASPVITAVADNTVETADIKDGAVTAAKLAAGAGLPDAIDVNASAPSDSVNIDASGNVGIGTSSPPSYGTGFTVFQVNGSSSGIVQANNSTNSITTEIESESTRGSIGTRTNHSLAFKTNQTERMRIDSSGNVGIGTASPSAKLQTTIGSGSSAGIKYLNAGGSGLQFYTDSTASNADIYIESPLTGVAMIFRNSGTERMRIDSSGQVLINTTSVLASGSVLQVSGPAGAATSVIKVGTNGNGAFVFRNESNSTVGSISANASSTTYSTSSDYRLKENIAPMTGALATVSQLNPVTYTWKSTGEQSQGFIAHELQTVVPDCVTGEKDAVDADGNPVYQGIDTSFLVATLTAAIKEQQAIIESLTARIEALEAQNNV